MTYLIRKGAIGSFILLAALVSCTGDRDSSRSPIVPISTPPPVTDRPKIIAYGDSLIAGYGIEAWQNGFSAALQRDIDDAGYDFQVLNYGNSGDTAEQGLARLHLALGVSSQRIFILELGANNISKKDDPNFIGANLRKIIEQLQARNIDILLCGYRSPPGHGYEYARSLENMYASLAAEYNVALMPDFMADVSGDPELMQPDGIHPNPNGVRKIEKNVFNFLQPILAKYERSK
jgi:acyl-CoA thioesterase-1